MRHVIEATWFGPQGPRVAHRRVVTSSKRAAKFAAITGVKFTDGTFMSVRTRECKPRERIEEVGGYDALLDNAVRLGTIGTYVVK